MLADYLTGLTAYKKNEETAADYTHSLTSYIFLLLVIDFQSVVQISCA